MTRELWESLRRRFSLEDKETHGPGTFPLCSVSLPAPSGPFGDPEGTLSPVKCAHGYAHASSGKPLQS
jgi:hypothetical protein